jgi:hypothetical protein
MVSVLSVDECVALLAALVNDFLTDLVTDLVPWVAEFNRLYVNPTFPDLEPSILNTGDQTV